MKNTDVIIKLSCMTSASNIKKMAQWFVSLEIFQHRPTLTNDNWDYKKSLCQQGIINTKGKECVLITNTLM